MFIRLIHESETGGAGYLKVISQNTQRFYSRPMPYGINQEQRLEPTDLCATVLSSFQGTNLGFWD